MGNGYRVGLVVAGQLAMGVLMERHYRGLPEAGNGKRSGAAQGFSPFRLVGGGVRGERRRVWPPTGDWGALSRIGARFVGRKERAKALGYEMESEIHSPNVVQDGRRSRGGRVSIVVPARNEAKRLPELLRSLRDLEYPDYEVLVVDDGSEDGTGDVAATEGATVLRIEGPEPGWTGKAYACWRGAEATSGRWILFTDADTVHGPGSLDAALATAREHDADLVSFLARQRCETFWERLLLPYAYALYFVGAGLGGAIANGQYILIRRDAYERVGGHAAVRDSVIEDVALAQLASAGGLTVVLARGEGEVTVRMYGGLTDIWEGMGKNAARFVTVSPRSGAVTVVAGLLIGISLPLLSRVGRVGRLALLLTPAIILGPWYRRFGVSPVIALLHPLAAGVFQVLALDSIRKMVTGTPWKSRVY